MKTFIASHKIKIALVVFGLAIAYFSTNHKSYYSTYDALKYYGFEAAEQKEALEDLFQLSSVLSHDQSWQDGFPNRTDVDLFFKDILKILQETQNKFVARTGTQERWEVGPQQWMTNNQETIQSHLKTLGFADEASPKKKNTDAVCILGAAKIRMVDRINYASHLMKEKSLETKTIILLGGERHVTEGVDGTEAELSSLAQSLKIRDWHQLTETHLIEDIYKNSDLVSMNLQVHTIDTPKRDLPRPTTQTTILELMTWLRHHPEIQSITFVSNQPYVPYQKAIIESIFKSENLSPAIEVVGPKTSDSSAKSLVEALGSYLWAKTPAVLEEMKIAPTHLDIKKALGDLYKSHPLIYKILPKTL